MRLALTKRTDYAIRAVMCLARSAPGTPVPARRIAAEMAIPPRFVPHVLADLVRAGLVEGTTGKLGGYRVTRDLDGLSLLELIEAVEGVAGGDACTLDADPCDPGRPCQIHHALSGARDAFVGVLADTSVADIVGRPRAAGDPREGRVSPERNMA